MYFLWNLINRLKKTRRGANQKFEKITVWISSICWNNQNYVPKYSYYRCWNAPKAQKERLENVFFYFFIIFTSLDRFITSGKILLESVFLRSQHNHHWDHITSAIFQKPIFTNFDKAKTLAETELERSGKIFYYVIKSERFSLFGVCVCQSERNESDIKVSIKSFTRFNFTYFERNLHSQVAAFVVKESSWISGVRWCFQKGFFRNRRWQ